MKPLQLERGRHLVRETTFTKYIQRELDPDLMTYLHLVEDVWVVALWINKAKGVVLELAILEDHPNASDRRTVQKLKDALFGGLTIEEAKRRCRTIESETADHYEEMNASWQDEKRACRKYARSMSGRESPVFQP